MNGHSGRSSRSTRRYQQDSDGASSTEQDGDVGTRRLLKRKTARAAVNKMKLLEASDEDFEEEKQPTRSSSRLRHTARNSKRAAVIQSSSESDREQSTQGRKCRRLPDTRSTWLRLRLKLFAERRCFFFFLSQLLQHGKNLGTVVMTVTLQAPPTTKPTET